MSAVRNAVRRGFYLDSIALMRLSQAVARLDGVEEAALMMGTPANRAIMADARVLSAEGEAAGPGDLVIAVRAETAAAADAAVAEAGRRIDQPRGAANGATAAWQPRTIASAVKVAPDANLALISVPGAFAAAEALKAMRRGLHVMIFSDNVPLAEEVELKVEGRRRGLLVMGPDCGTAIIAGTPLAFANAVPPGDIGIVGASGTGIQEVTSLIARSGRGISHALGTGGRDLKAEVGGIATLMAIDALDADPATAHIVVISKPPAPDVMATLLARIAKSAKPFTLCVMGQVEGRHPANARTVATLKDAAEAAVGRAFLAEEPQPKPRAAPGRLIRGLFAGGTLCAEAQQVILATRASGGNERTAVLSNVPIAGAAPLTGSAANAHVLIDLGDDVYTQGRPHPMIEPAVRDQPLAEALGAREVGVVLLDVVLGTGSHADPAGHLASRLMNRPARGPLIVASVTGTELDPQRRSDQVRRLEEAGVLIAPSAADAARLALACVEHRGA